MVSFKGSQFPRDVILHAMYFYSRYGVSYRDLEEFLAERGDVVDHATLNRWVIEYSHLVALNAQAAKRKTIRSWRMDETYVRVRGKWQYLYRAVGRHGNTLDFMLLERRKTAAAKRFIANALASNGIPEKIVIDKSGANKSGIRESNKIFKRFGCPASFQTVQSKYLNNWIEPHHRFIKRRIRNMGGFGSFHRAAATLAGIEVANMIRKRQFENPSLCGFQQFAKLAG